jgi:hypothetical protein
MKNTIKLFALVFGMSFYFTGCYTIVWDPREEFPDTENSYDEGSSFYETEYYGNYVDYYESPWWISVPVYITYPGETDNSTTKNRNNGRSSDTENIRNSNGRGNTDRNSGTTNDNTTTTTTTTTNSGNSGNSGVINTPPPTRDSNSGSTTNTSSSSSTSNTRNSGSNDTRNSSGSRNSGSGRK